MKDKEYQDYTNNMIFKLNLNNISSQTGVALKGNGITINDNQNYLSFDGTSCIEISNDVIVPDATKRSIVNCTLCCWYRTQNTGNATYGTYLIGFGDYGTSGIRNKHYLSLESQGVAAAQGYDTCARHINPSDFNDNDWHFLVGIWEDNSKVKVYYDSVPFSGTGSYTASNAYVNIGVSSDFNALNYTGDLADVRIYDTALTSTQVKQIYEYGKQLYK